MTLFCLTACSPRFIPLCTLVSALKDFNQHDITSVRNKRGGGKKTVHSLRKSSARQSRISLTGSNSPSEAQIIKMSTGKCEHGHKVSQNAALLAQNSQDPEELLP